MGKELAKESFQIELGLVPGGPLQNGPIPNPLPTEDVEDGKELVVRVMGSPETGMHAGGVELPGLLDPLTLIRGSWLVNQFWKLGQLKSDPRTKSEFHVWLVYF